MSPETTHPDEAAIQDWLDGDLDSDATRALLGHLETCEACRRDHRALLATDALLTLAPPPQGLIGAVRPRARTLAAAAALVLVLVVATGVVWWFGRESPIADEESPAPVRATIEHLTLRWSRQRAGHTSVSHWGMGPQGIVGRVSRRPTSRSPAPGDTIITLHHSRERTP